MTFFLINIDYINFDIAIQKCRIGYLFESGNNLLLGIVLDKTEQPIWMRHQVNEANISDIIDTAKHMTRTNED